MSTVLLSTSNADDAAHRSLVDVCELVRGRDDVRVVGGHMAALYAEISGYGLPVRRTRDADAALSPELATTGSLHEQLERRGYEATSGNGYDGPDNRHVDLLVPSTTGLFTQVEHGGRSFDAAPGVLLALACPPVLVDVQIVFQAGGRASAVYLFRRSSLLSSSRRWPAAAGSLPETQAVMQIFEALGALGLELAVRPRGSTD